MESQAKSVVFVVDFNDDSAQHWTTRKVKALVRVFSSDSFKFRFPLAWDEMAHVDHRDHDFQFRQDGLLRFTVDSCEDRSQCFVTFDDLVDAPAQRFNVECALEPEDNRNVICRSVGVETIENPQSLLCVGEWKDLIAIGRHNRRRCGRVTANLTEQVYDFRFARSKLCEQISTESFRRRAVTQTLAFDPQLYVEVAQV